MIAFQKKETIYSVFNILIRLVTMAGKFLLIIFLGRYLNPENVGEYGLITATVGYSIYIIGFEYYSYSNRELVLTKNIEIKNIIMNQFIFYTCMYILFLPIIFILSQYKIINLNFLYILFPILIIEHIGQEFHRIIISLRRPIMASVLLFFRTGFWPYMCMLVMYFIPSTRNLIFLLSLWLITIFITVFFAYIKLEGLILPANFKFDYKWIKRGIIISLPFFVASICFRGVFTIDRFYFGNSFGLSKLGAYVIYVSIAQSAMTFIDAGIIDFAYPKIIASSIENVSFFKSNLIDLAKKIILISFFFLITCWILCHPLFSYLGNKIYLDNYSIFKWILLSTFLYSLNMIPHVALYSLSIDKPIIYSTVIAFVFFILFVKSFILILGLSCIPIALCLFFGILLIYKSVAFIILIKKIERLKNFWNA